MEKIDESPFDESCPIFFFNLGSVTFFKPGWLPDPVSLPPEQQQAQLKVDPGLAFQVPGASVHLHDGRAVRQAQVAERPQDER